jgi:hypothetical protein
VAPGMVIEGQTRACRPAPLMRARWTASWADQRRRSSAAGLRPASAGASGPTGRCGNHGHRPVRRAGGRGGRVARVLPRELRGPRSGVVGGNRFRRRAARHRCRSPSGAAARQSLRRRPAAGGRHFRAAPPGRAAGGQMEPAAVDALLRQTAEHITRIRAAMDGYGVEISRKCLPTRSFPGLSRPSATGRSSSTLAVTVEDAAGLRVSDETLPSLRAVSDLIISLDRSPRREHDRMNRPGRQRRPR